MMKVIFKNVHAKEAQVPPTLKIKVTLRQMRLAIAEWSVTAFVSWSPLAMRQRAGTWR
mgnify:CR=1 FL=1